MVIDEHYYNDVVHAARAVVATFLSGDDQDTASDRLAFAIGVMAGTLDRGRELGDGIRC